MRIELTIKQRDYLVGLMNEERQNLLEDLSGSEQVQISDTAARVLNASFDTVAEIHKQLISADSDNS